jgi:hypothetical protein
MNFHTFLPLLFALFVISPTPGGPGLVSPLEGQALQGTVPIMANVAADGFKSAEITFRYASGPTQTWFFITQTEELAGGGKIADWDTTTLTDGNYDLRLEITMQDGSVLTTTATGLRVRNYSPIETATPTSPAPSPTSAPGETPPPTATLVPSPSPIPLTATPLPPNPIQVSPRDLGFSMAQGILAVIAVFALFGLVLAVRRRTRS